MAEIDLQEFTRGIAAQVTAMLEPLRIRLAALEAAPAPEPAAPPAPLEVDVNAAALALASTPEVKTVVDLIVAEQLPAYLRAHPPEKGESGAAVCGAMIDTNGHLIVTTSDGKMRDVGLVKGTDGVGFDDMTPSIDADGSVRLEFRRGDVRKTVTFHVPVMRHLGFWQQGITAACGDTVTHNGSLWIARRDNNAEPGYDSPDWFLAARKGADGKDKR